MNMKIGHNPKPQQIKAQKADKIFDSYSFIFYNTENIDLKDVIDIEVLQRIQDAFARVHGLGSVIVDNDNRLITDPSNFNEVCRLIKQTEKGRKRCELSDKIRDEKALSLGRPVYHQCLSCGFTDGSAPIIIGNKHVADWLIGQANVTDVSREHIAAYAREIGADSELLLAAFDKIPRITVEKFELILELLYAIAGEISRIGFNNLKMAHEIESRRIIEKELKTAQADYHELVNSLMEGIGIVDENEKIIFANPAFARIFGVDAIEQILGRSILEYIDARQHTLIFRETGKRKQGKSSQYELSTKNENGGTRNILVSVSPRFNDNGQYRGALGAVIDITENKRLQNLTQRAERLELAGRIAAQVAHDFNNLLGPLVAYPEIIKTELPPESASRELLDDMETAAKTIADINQQLLTLGRRGYYEQEVLNMNSLIQKVLSMLYETTECPEFKLSLCPQLMNIKGGECQLIRVITNVINNSLDALDDDEKISIKTENYSVNRYFYRTIAIPDGEYVKVTISDNGRGIAGRNLPFIFDPFYSTKTPDKKRGSGLGLSVVHAVVRDHNGYVDIKSTPGQGTSVFLYFPVTEEGDKDNSSDVIIGGHEKILIVDDDNLQRDVAVRLLKKLGYRAVAIESGEKALTMLKHESYDMLIIDIIMAAGMDGVATYQEVLKIAPGQKAIIVSGFAESEKINVARKLGLSTFLKKPLTKENLALAVRKELERG